MFVTTQHLGEIYDELLELRARFDDLERRAEGQARMGIVNQVDPVKGLCKVSHGALMTPWVKWFNPSAGEVRETRVPSVGEQCLLINHGGGDNGAHFLALTGLPSDTFPPVSTEANVRKQVSPDGTTWSYDHAASVFSWKNGPLSVKADRSGVEVMLGGVGFKLGAGGFSHIGAAVTHDGVSIGAEHAHSKVKGGNEISGAPI